MKVRKSLVCLGFALALLLCAVAIAEGMPDGVCVPDAFSFSGGTGRVEIDCPRVAFEGGDVVATVRFSSPHYTTVTYDGEVYEAKLEDGFSCFDLPAPLNRSFEISAVTTAMSRPHEITYTLFIRLDAALDADAVDGMIPAGSMKLDYARGFAVDYFEGGYALIDVAEGGRYLTVPEGMPIPDGLDPGVTVLQKPIGRIYLAATSAMALFNRLDALDRVAFSSLRAEDWHVEAAAEAMRAGAIRYAGKYSEPDYELLVKENCGLAVESTMLLHVPKVRELLELLNIPVFIDRSSYESHPLGRMEWIKLYAALLDREEEAEAFFDAQRKNVEALLDYPPSGKTVAFFYMGTDGSAVVRGAADYVARMIELGGGTYAFADMGEPERSRASVSCAMEDFYARAVDADYLIYSAAIDPAVRCVDDLIARSALFKDFRAVREGHVFRAGGDLYQATDIAVNLIGDIHDMLDGRVDGMTFLEKMN